MWTVIVAADLPNDEIPDLSHLREQVERTLRRFMPTWDDLAASMKAQLVEQVELAISNDDFTALARLSADAGPGAEAFYEQLQSIADWSGAQTAAEIEEQDVDVTARTPPRASLSGVAFLTVSLLAAELAISAARATLAANGSGRPRSEVGEYVREYLDGLSDASAERQFGGALHGTLNAARELTMRAAPEGSVYASEMNDANTCKPCRQVNGRFLGLTSQMDQIARSYPSGAYGGYIHCYGGPACRGTVFGVWRSKQTEESDR